MPFKLRVIRASRDPRPDKPRPISRKTGRVQMTHAEQYASMRKSTHGKRMHWQGRHPWQGKLWTPRDPWASSEVTGQRGLAAAPWTPDLWDAINAPLTSAELDAETRHARE